MCVDRNESSKSRGKRYWCWNRKLCVCIAGIFRGGAEILVRSKLALADGVNMQLTVRSTDADVAEMITSAVGWNWMLLYVFFSMCRATILLFINSTQHWGGEYFK